MKLKLGYSKYPDRLKAITMCGIDLDVGLFQMALECSRYNLILLLDSKVLEKKRKSIFIAKKLVKLV